MSDVRPVITVELVSPEQAELWLATANVDNRTLRIRHTGVLARDMREGRWLQTGDGIKFDMNGVLVDGQHRLSAVVAYGHPVEMVVVRNVSSAVKSVVDSGLRRTASDVLGFAGIPNGAHVAAVARLALGRDDGLFQFARDTRKGTYPAFLVLEYLEANPAIQEWALETQGHGRALGFVPAAWSYASYVLTLVDRAGAATFVDSIINSRTDGAGDPRLVLLRYGQFARAGRKTREKSNAATQTAETIYITFRAWNAWRDGETATQFPFTGSQSGERGFRTPVPH